VQLLDKIFSVNNRTFEEVALEVYRYQFEQVEIYRLFCESLKKTPASVNHVDEIPFLPIEFFKSHEVIKQGAAAIKVFESSGTTGTTPSRHFVADTGIYERSFLKGFELFYGAPGEFTILALLPSYLERGNSSLIYMADKLITLSGKKESGFFLNEFEKLSEILLDLKGRGEKVILLGVTFALLDFAEQFQINFPNLIVMETGGMKGRRDELTREEVHERLCSTFGVSKIHSEYGMTELLSQAYSKGYGIFEAVPWMKIIARDVYDPLRFQEPGRPGAVNIIDLANIFSCSFIATNDLAKVNEEGSFEILGRMDNAEIRGCNLMVL
jgi:phenylacetate-coenzyme A ligase PaaK-like adenylate-forming protein